MGSLAEQLGKLAGDLETQKTLAIPYSSTEGAIRMGLTRGVLLPLCFRL